VQDASCQTWEDEPAAASPRSRAADSGRSGSQARGACSEPAEPPEASAGAEPPAGASPLGASLARRVSSAAGAAREHFGAAALQTLVSSGNDVLDQARAGVRLWSLGHSPRAAHAGRSSSDLLRCARALGCRGTRPRANSAAHSVRARPPAPRASPLARLRTRSRAAEAFRPSAKRRELPAVY